MNEWEWQLLEDKAPLESICISDRTQLRRGDRVRLRPRPGGDVMDLALAGRIAVVESIEQDYEGSVQLGVVIDDDPGLDIGNLRQPAHRFFFRPEEVEAITHTESNPALPCILVAGIGNVFFGDDGFGVEAAARLAVRGLPACAHAIDFGIRSYDLAYELTSGRYDAAILLDASARGGNPGTLYVIAPSLDDVSEPAPSNAHAMNPESVLKMARTFGPLPGQILVVGCEPETLGGAEGQFGLSQTVDAAVDRAVPIVEALVNRISSGEQINGAEVPKEITECK